LPIQEILEIIMQKEKISQYRLAKRVGVSKQAISQMLKAKDIKMSLLLSILEVMGYEFVIRKVKTDEHKKGRSK